MYHACLVRGTAHTITLHQYGTCDDIPWVLPMLASVRCTRPHGCCKMRCAQSSDSSWHGGLWYCTADATMQAAHLSMSHLHGSLTISPLQRQTPHCVCLLAVSGHDVPAVTNLQTLQLLAWLRTRFKRAQRSSGTIQMQAAVRCGLGASAMSGPQRQWPATRVLHPGLPEPA